MQEHAAPKKTALEREDWMSKAMPKSIPEATPETADKAKEQPAKKVTLLSRTQIGSGWHRKAILYMTEFAEHRSCLAQGICKMDVTAGEQNTAV